MRLDAGEIVALVGPSGGGKSTLLNLVPRLYEPSAGTIRIDGADVRDFSLSSLRRSIALVSQDVILLDDTVRANITYGAGVPEDEESIWSALQDACALDFVRQLPEGLDTRVGERGSFFSGGQRQRLALARALYRGAPILLLDEPTSSLDRDLEQDIREALTRLAGKKTILIVSHRLPIVEFADRIYVMLKGQIVEEGTAQRAHARRRRLRAAVRYPGSGAHARHEPDHVSSHDRCPPSGPESIRKSIRCPSMRLKASITGGATLWSCKTSGEISQ